MVAEHNPYAPTKAALNEVSADEPGDVVELASRGRRLANFLLDAVGYVVVSMMIGIVFAIVNLLSGIDLLAPLGPLFGLGVAILYYVLSEALFGRTLGKLVTGTRVVAESGGPAKPWQVLLRTLYRFVPFEAISFLSKRRPGWHDRWSKTRVVLARRG